MKRKKTIKTVCEFVKRILKEKRPKEFISYLTQREEKNLTQELKTRSKHNKEAIEP